MINRHENKDRGYFLIWERSIWKLSLKVNISGAIIQRIWTFGENLRLTRAVNLCQPW